MKRTTLWLSSVLLAVPAAAHPGTAGEHELLSVVGHLVLTALPLVAVVGLIALAAPALLRKIRGRVGGST